MNALTTEARKSSPPSVITRDLDRLVARIANAVETTPSGRVEISSAVAPSDDERRVVQARIAELTASLARSEQRQKGDLGHTEKVAVSAMVAKLLGGMTTMGAGESSAQMKVDLCVSALARFPLWAVAEACAAIRDGQVRRYAGSEDIGIRRGYPPEAPQLAELCRRIIAPVHTELANLHRIMSAKVYQEPGRDEMQRKQVVDEILSRFDGSWGIRTERPRRDVFTPDAACMSTLGITQEQFDAIPDAKR